MVYFCVCGDEISLMSLRFQRVSILP